MRAASSEREQQTKRRLCYENAAAYCAHSHRRDSCSYITRKLTRSAAAALSGGGHSSSSSSNSGALLEQNKYKFNGQ